ncbi:alpha-hydroxy acid oxidase [Paracandidimonas soli]|uniref:alpha-hydroxy acid oxidase n=1 Tax=Paracandidimonas soli TaxID=1917182 RepID=UPI000A431DB1
MKHSLQHILCLDDFEPAARRRLPRPLFGYVSGATENNVSLRANRLQFDVHAWVTRAMVNVAKRDQSASLFGRTYQSPFGIAPMGICALTAYRGDLMLSRAAADAGIPMVLSSSSLIRLEDVAEQAPGTWFQSYLPRGEQEAAGLFQRLRDSRYEVLVITVDSAVVPNRENNLRNGFKTPLRPNLSLLYQGVTHPRWACGTFLRTLLRHGMPYFENASDKRGAPLIARDVTRDFSGREHLDWDTLKFVRKQWTGPLVLKGILDPEDARKASAAGVDGIIVSNHGGRQLDHTVAPLQVLPEIADAARNMTVMADSGFRRGTDVLKALALGAQFVFVGRPFNYAAALAGYDGVAHAIALLRAEIHADMGLLGINRLQELNPARLRPGLVRSAFQAS